MTSTVARYRNSTNNVNNAGYNAWIVSIQSTLTAINSLENETRIKLNQTESPVLKVVKGFIAAIVCFVTHLRLNKSNKHYIIFKQTNV